METYNLSATNKEKEINTIKHKTLITDMRCPLSHSLTNPDPRYTLTIVKVLGQNLHT